MTTPTWLRDKRVLIGGGAVLVIVLAIGFFMLLMALFGNKNTDTQNQNGTGESSNTDGIGGTGLSGDVRKLIGSVKSTRNLKGLTLRINQIDVCTLPDLTAFVAVTTDSGDVSRLSSKDIKVELDGETVNNVKFEPINTASQPLSATLVIDRSGSMAGAPLDQAKNAANLFIDKTAPNDRIGVVQFDHTVQTVTGLTTDRAAAHTAVNQITLGGDTSLYDAVGQGVSVTNGCSRRAVVVLSDGGDRMSSTYNLDSAVNAANRAGLPLFVVGLKGETYDANVLRALADRTGGQLFETDNPAALADLYTRVDAQLKGQYYVGFKLEGVAKDGKEHRLKITSTVEGSPTTSERSFIY
jgi:VWFA-related protein